MGVKSSGGYVGAAVLWLVCLLALAGPAAGANTVSITSTPANGIAYVAGETITTRFSFPRKPRIVAVNGRFSDAKMKLDVGGATRLARITTSFATALAYVDFSYTVQCGDRAAGGIGIPANSITGPAWFYSFPGPRRTPRFRDRSHVRLAGQSAHEIAGCTASVSSTNPAGLTEGNLNTATLTVTLEGTTFSGGVTASGFALVAPGIPGLSIASATAAAGGATATLTLSFSGDLTARQTLAVRVKAATHAHSGDLTTATVNVASTEEAPTFGAATVPDKFFPKEVALTPFQVPAASGGNGALFYSVSDLPAGLRFDATGTDATGCPGPTPRTLCGRPIVAGAYAVTVHAHDADANRAASDRAGLDFNVTVFGASVSSTHPATLTETNLNGATVTVELAQTTFASGVTASGFALETAIPGLSIASATAAGGGTTATLTLSFSGDFTARQTLAVRVKAAAHARGGDLTTATVNVAPTDEAPTFGDATVQDKYVPRSFTNSFQIPAATGGNGTLSYSVSGLPQGINFFASGLPGFLPLRTIYGSANTFGTHAVTVHAHDADANRAASDRASLDFNLTVVGAWLSTNPTVLTETNLNGATVTVELAGTTFASGVTASSFELGVPAIPGLSIASVSGGAAGGTTATLTLAFTGDLTGQRILRMIVKAAALSGDFDLDVSSSFKRGYQFVTINPTTGATVGTPSLALEEAPGSTRANVGTYTVVMTSNLRYRFGAITCRVSIDATSDNADVTVDSDSTPQSKRLNFDPSNWNVPQTITVTAAHDADGIDDAATISHRRVGETCSRDYFGTPTFPSVSVAVNDDETPTAVIDSPATLTPTTLNNATVTVSLAGTTFGSGVTASGFELVTGIPNVSIASVSGGAAGSTTATLTLAWSGTLAADAKLAVKVLAAAHAGDTALTTGQIDVLGAADAAPSFGAATVPDKSFHKGVAITPFQVPAATGGNGAIGYTAAGLPSGLRFDVTGADATGCPGSTPRTLCGTPIVAGASAVTVHAHDADANRAASDRASLDFDVTVVGASVSTHPAALTEADLNGATVTVTLSGTTFDLGVFPSDFELVTAIPGLSIASATAAAGSSTATLTLAFTGDIATDRTLAVRVKGAAHARGGNLPTGTVNVSADAAPSFGSATVPTKNFPQGTAITPFQVPAATGGNGAISYTAANLPSGLTFDATGTDADGCPGAAPRTVCGTPTSPGNPTVRVYAADADSNRGDDDRASLGFNVRVYGASIASTRPAALTEGTLNNATVTVNLSRTTFGSGVTASGFELVTAIPNVSIASLSGGTSGSSTATLTLAFTGNIATDQTLAVRVKAATHVRGGDLTTGAVTVLTAADTAPSFGSARISGKSFRARVAITPFQVPAATGGNGAIRYTAASLPPGLTFDATGNDADGCPGTAPRTVCGTPTLDLDRYFYYVTVRAHDADSNRAGSDSASLSFLVRVYGASIVSTSPSALTEGTLHNATVTVNLWETTFVSRLYRSSFALVTAIPNVSIASVSRVNSSTATLTLAFTGDFATDQTLAVRVESGAHARGGDLTTNAVHVSADTAPSFGSVRVPQKFSSAGVAITPFQVPAATGGDGPIRYTTSSLPLGLTFDATGTDADGCPGTAPRTVCGTPTSPGRSTVMVYAADADSNRSDDDRASLILRLVVAGASIASTSPALLTEGTLNNATVTVSLSQDWFRPNLAASSFALFASSFELVTAIPNVSIASVSGGVYSRSTGSSTATLTLAFTGDFATDRTLAVRVKANAVRSSSVDLTTGAVTVLAATAADAAPSFGGVTVPDKSFGAGVAIPPFQVPAATGGNGAIRYTAAGLPPGLTFDATGTDADGCPGATPRTVCGTPTGPRSGYVRVYAADADSNRGDNDRDSLTISFDIYGASISSTSPALLTETNLNGATVTVNLSGATFGSGLTASGFALETAIPNVSIASVSGVTSGGTTATLRLAFTGNVATDRTLAVRVKAAAHVRGGDLITDAVTVLAGAVADVAPTFGHDPMSILTRKFSKGVAITPFQIRAASGGNGAISYTASGLPSGLTFDATGTDAAGCPGTAPRTVCGTPTGTGRSTVWFSAADADSNRRASDSDWYRNDLDVFGASIASTHPAALTEGTLHGAALTVKLLSGITFDFGEAQRDDFELVTAIPNVSIARVSGVTSGDTTVTLTLAFTGDIATDQTLAVRVKNVDLRSIGLNDRVDLTTDAVNVLAAGADPAPSFDSATVPDKHFREDVAITPFQVPAATGGNGAIRYTASGLPPGLKFDATGTDADGCPGIMPRTLCGTPTGSGQWSVRVYAADVDSNWGDSLTIFFNIYGVSIESIRPEFLTEGTLNNAIVIVELIGTDFGSEVIASGFELVTAIPNVSIASVVENNLYHNPRAHLTLAFTGNIATDQTLAVKVKAAAHARDGDLTTDAFLVVEGMPANMAPSFGSATVPAKFFREGVAITPFQVPAATGGNGPISYTASGLPPGLRFDATGTDANGCPGATPRTVCGTPTGKGSWTIRVNANDADGLIHFIDDDDISIAVIVPGASIASTHPAALTEGTLHGATVTVDLIGHRYSSGVTTADFELVTAIPNVSIASFSGGGFFSTRATLTLAFTGDFATNQTLAVRVKANAVRNSSVDLTTDAVTVLAAEADTAPTFGRATVPDKHFRAGMAITPFQVPAATGGNGAIRYTASGLPPGFKFDATGTDLNGCPGTTPRTLCGTPTVMDGDYSVTVHAHDADSDRSLADAGVLSFVLSEYDRASISYTIPLALTKDNLNDATVTVQLSGTTFLSGVTVSDFALVTAIPDVSIASVSNVRSGSATATLRLAFTGDFATDRTLAVRVKAAAHAHIGDLTTDAVSVLVTAVAVAVADTAPSFSYTRVPDKFFGAGVAITPFQVPAATGGNGAISYTVANLPTGLKFDATGTDATGCPGTAPRTVCGTPTGTPTGRIRSKVYAADADSNRGDDDQATFSLGFIVYGASIASARPAALTEGTLNTATVTVNLSRTTFGSGVNASGFELVTAIPNVSIASVSNVRSGSTTATLTLAFTGDFATDQTLAVRVKAAAHVRGGDLTTGAVPVLAGTAPDVAPTFGRASVFNKLFLKGAAITPFHIPAATGGNGAISYTAPGLPPGLRFDATGMDVCPGTAPRTVCGTPTVMDGDYYVTVYAHDADSNRAASDRASLSFRVRTLGARIASTHPAVLTEDTLNGATVTVELTGITFGSGVTASGFEVTGIPGLSIASVSGGVSGSTTATLTLAFTGDFAKDRTLSVIVWPAALTRGISRSGLRTDRVLVLAGPAPPDVAPTFGRARFPDKHFPEGVAITPFQVPAATSGNGYIRYTAADLPPGLMFDATGRGGCPGTAPRTVCGTPTVALVNVYAVAVHAHDDASNRADSDRASLSFNVHVYGARIASTHPAALTEGNLHGATVTVRLTDTGFARGVTASDFELVTAIPNVSIASLSGGTSGSSTATLTLAFTGDFATDRTLAVRVKAAAHVRGGDLTTGAVTVPAGAAPDAAPSFSAATIPGKDFPEGVAITPFQVPAATGGNGPIRYTAAGLPPGLGFDATGRGGCPGTAPRTVCGTPTVASVNVYAVTVHAHDADSNRAASDRASLSFNVRVRGARILSTHPAALAEGNLHGATVTVKLSGATFGSGVTASGFALETAIPNVSIASVSGGASGASTATLTLAFTGDFATDRTLAVRVKAAAHARGVDLITDSVNVLAATVADVAPSFGGATFSDRYFPEGLAITPFQVPAATGGNGAIRYTAAGLPPGLTFDATGTDADGCPGATPRTVCGTPTGPRSWWYVRVFAADADSNRGDDDRASLRFDVNVYGAPIASTPAALTEGTLNNATVTVSLAGTTFRSGVTASGFELVTAIPNVSIASVSNVRRGGTTATLTLAFTGDFATDQTLAVRVKAAAHDYGDDLTTNAIHVSAVDTAPSFGSATVPTKFFPLGAAITPFQVPAATGGNGAIRYTFPGLPLGLTFDATGTDADGCPGAAPRTVCGTPTGTDFSTVRIYAEDADSNRGDDDRASLGFDVRVYGASIASTSPAALTEGTLNNATVTVNLSGTAFGSGVTASGFELVTAIPNVSIASLSGGTSGASTAALTLAFTGDFATDRTLAVRVKAAAHARGGDLTTGAVPVLAGTAPDAAPSFGGASVRSKSFREGVAITPFQVPAATGGNGPIRYTAVSLPSGLTFDATGTDADGCPGATPRTVCGTPTGITDSSVTVEIYAHDADSNRGIGDVGVLSFRLTEKDRARIASTNPASLTESTLRGARVTVRLTGTTFVSGVTTSSFELLTPIPRVSIAGVSGGASGSTTATLSLRFEGDFATDQALAVRVKAAAHAGAGDLLTDAVRVSASTAPMFGSAMVPTRYFPKGEVAITPFQIPAATSNAGDVAIRYSGSRLPPGLKFDADGSGSCRGATPRTVCGIPTATGRYDGLISAVYADRRYGSSSSSADSDRLTQPIVIYGASIASTNPSSPTESTLNTATVTVRLADTTFASGVTASGFELVTAIPTLTISSLSGAAAGSTTATLTLAFTGDFTTPQTLAVRVKAAAHARAGDLTTGTVTVNPTVGATITPTDFALQEAPGDVRANVDTYTVALVANPGSGCSVTIEATSDNADVTVDADGSPRTRRVTFGENDWNVPQTITVTVGHDLDGVDDTATIGHRRVGTCGYFGNPTFSGVSVTVDDDVTHGVSLSETALDVDEEGSVSYTAAFTAQPLGGAVTVTVGGAGSGVTVDTDGETSGDQNTLTFTASDYAEAQTVVVSAADDANAVDEVVTLTHTVSVADYGANAVTAVTAGSVVVTVADDETPRLAIDGPSVNEGDVGSTTMTFTVTLIPASIGQVTVGYEDAGTGTATSGTDYTALTAGTLTFAAGETGKTFTVSVTGDTTDEPDETIAVTIGNPDPADTPIRTPVGTGTITDDDAAPTVTLALSSTSMTEMGGVSTVSATLSHPSSAVTTVTVTPVSDFYTVGTDATIVIAAGETANATDVATVTAVDDAVHQGSSGRATTVTGTASNAQATAEGKTVAVTGAALMLTDDEVLPTVALVLSEPDPLQPDAINESGAGNVSTVTATLSGPSSEAVTLTVSATAVAPAEAGDYTQSGTLLTIAAGSTTSTGTVTLTAVDNAVDAPNKSVTVSATASGGNTVANPAPATLTLTDDEAAPTVTLALSTTSMTEMGGVTTVSATLSHPSSAVTTVTVTPVSDFYTVGADATIVIAAGETANATDVATVAAVNDDVHQGSGGRAATVTGTAANAQAAAEGETVAVTGAALMLTDDEAPPTVALVLSPASIDEDGGVSTVTATLSVKSSEAVTVTVGAAAGMDAVSGDFALSPAKTLTIASGTTTSTGTVTVTAVDNPISSASKSVTVSGTATGGNGVAAPSDVTLTITDGAPTVTLVLSSSSIDESGTSNVATVTARLSAGASEAVTLTVSSTAVSPAEAGDFTQSGTLLTIAAGSTTSTGTVTLTAVDNAVDAPDKSVTVSATASGDDGVTDPAPATLTLTDDEALPTVALVLSEPDPSKPDAINESGAGNASTVTATLSGESSEAVTLTVSATAVSPAEAGDFTQSGTLLTIAARSTTSTGTVTLTAVDNAADAPDKSVTVSATASGGNTVANPDAATLTLTDDEAAPTVTLALSSTSMTEMGGVTTVSATLSHPSSAVTTVTVTPVSDFYTVGADATIVIAAGETANATDMATVTAVDDAVHQGSDGRATTVTGTASNAQATAEGETVAVTGAALTLTDDEALPTVALVLSEPDPLKPDAINESGAGNVSTVTATLSGPSSEAVTLTVSATAVAPAVAGDFTQSGTLLTIAAGSTTSTGTVTLTAVDNAVDAPDKSVTVSATAAGGNTVASPDAATLTLTDDEAAPEVTLALSTTAVTEAGGQATVNATLSHPSSAATTVTVTVTAGATAYTVASGAGATIVIAAGDTANASDTATITAVDNAVDAADNMVTVTGTAANSQAAANSETMTVTGASLTITDDDTAGLEVSPETTTSSRLRTTEGGGTAAFEVELGSEPTGNVVLAVASSAPTEGTVSVSSLTFTATTWSTAQTVTLTGVDDAPANPADGDRNYTVTLTVSQESTADAIYDALSAVTVYAVNADNEYGLDVGVVTGQATEAGGTAAFTVALNTRPSAAVTVSVTSRDASEGAASPSSLTFETSDWDTAQAVTVTGADDAIDDGDVTWAVRLDPSSGDADYDGLSNVDVPVTTTDDDDAPGVVLAVSPASIVENGGTATVTAALSRASGAATTVTVTTVPGFYTVGSDAVIVIAAGETAAASDTATLAAVDNATDAPDRAGTVTATITNDRATADGTTLAVSGGALTVTDDDAAPNAALSLNPASVSENGGVSTVSATLTHPSSEPTTVTVTPVSGSYTVGSDAVIVIAAGETANATDTAAVAAVDNAKDEPDRTATVTATLTNSQGAGTVTGATLTLTDDDDAPALSIDAPSVTEGAAGATTTLTFTVRLGAASGRQVTVDYADAGTGTATSGTDYTAITAGTLTFAAGTTTRTIDVTVTGDPHDEAHETIAIALSAPVNATLGLAAGTGTVTDDDVAPTLSIDSPSVAEGTGATGGTLTFTVSLSTASGKQVTVGYADAGTGTATSGTDYTAVTAGTLTFAANETSRTFTVSVTGDAEGEPNETIVVTLGSPTNAMFSGGASSLAGTGTIVDDDATADVNQDGLVDEDDVLVMYYAYTAPGLLNRSRLRRLVLRPLLGRGSSIRKLKDTDDDYMTMLNNAEALAIVVGPLPALPPPAPPPP